MLLGYNRERPRREDYADFLDKLTKGLKDLDIDGLSLMIYGSYVRKEIDVGRSDIDAVMLFPEGVVIDKEHLASCAKVLSAALRGNDVPFQVTVSDMATIRDGRFNPYNPSFADYFRDERKVIVGPDYTDQFKFKMPWHPEQGPLTFNLRKCRQGLLFAEYDQKEDYEQFLKRFGKSLDAVSRGSKQVLFMADGKLRKNRFSALDRITQVFPSVDIEPLRVIQELYHHPEKLDALYRQPEELIRVWNTSVSFLETVLGVYIKNFPSQR